MNAPRSYLIFKHTRAHAHTHVRAHMILPWTSTSSLQICTDSSEPSLFAFTKYIRDLCAYAINRGTYMSVHVLLNLLKELGEKDKMLRLLSILSIFRNEFNKFDNTRARMLDYIYNYNIKISLKSHFCRKNVIIVSLYTQRCSRRHNVSRKNVNL